jgi:hypothetical protein
VLHWYSESQYISILFGVCDLQLGANPYSFGWLIWAAFLSSLK